MPEKYECEKPSCALLPLPPCPYRVKSWNYVFYAAPDGRMFAKRTKGKREREETWFEVPTNQIPEMVGGLMDSPQPKESH